MGKGVMVPVMFPGVEADFDGYLGYKAPPGMATHGQTLVVRQITETGITIVR
jgi:hypothetical protein